MHDGKPHIILKNCSCIALNCLLLGTIDLLPLNTVHQITVSMNLISISPPHYSEKGNINVDINYRKEDDRTPGEPFICSQCSKLFSSAGCLKRHVLNHSREKSYGCPFCGKSLSTTSNWKLHMRIHTGEKPFSCSDCDKVFSTSGSLKLHMRVHTGEKPYLCTECGKSFAQVSAMKIHLRVHTKERPFMCSACPRAFSTACILKKHCKKIHNE